MGSGGQQLFRVSRFLRRETRFWVCICGSGNCSLLLTPILCQWPCSLSVSGQDRASVDFPWSPCHHGICFWDCHHHSGLTNSSSALNKGSDWDSSVQSKGVYKCWGKSICAPLHLRISPMLAGCSSISLLGVLWRSYCPCSGLHLFTLVCVFSMVLSVCRCYAFGLHTCLFVFVLVKWW